MKRQVERYILCLVCWLLVTCGGHLVFGQALPNQTPTPAKQSSAGYEKTLTTLQGILQSSASLQEQLQQKKTLLQKAVTEEQKITLTTEINDLAKRLTLLERNFEEIATGIDPEILTTSPRTAFNWQEELQEVIGPLIEELKRLTARPREIERLRTEVAYYEKRVIAVQQALKNIRQLRTQAATEPVQDQLSLLEKSWGEREQELTNQLTVAQYRLDERLEEQQSLAQSAQDILRIFFKSRGRNLILAILAFIGVLILFRFLDRFVFKISSTSVSQKRTFYSRLINVIYQILTFLGAISALLLVFYVSGDWVLLGLSFIFLVGIAWTAKEGFPLFWEQIKLLLNLSTVRENERVVYKELPWKVASLNLYTKLHNPALKGGLIRLPLRELIGLHSRPFHKDEPWFPCQEDDWVLLADGTFGKIIMQTPEMVQLVLLGDSRRTYQTIDFLQQSPTNLSMNFRISVTFGIDYQHQEQSTQEIPDILENMLRQALQKAGYAEELLNLKVEFKEAGASSLDLAILADFSGDAAKDYLSLSRFLQRLAVDACNTHHWIIPFTQITVHGTTFS